MKCRMQSITVISYSILIFLISYGSNNDSGSTTEFPILRGDYLGQKKPGLLPKIFAPGIVSTDNNELNAVFSQDGKEFYFSVQRKTGQYAIMFMKQVNDQWKKPEVVSFSGIYSDADPFFSLDGKKLFFVSKRPIEGSGPPHDIWVAERISLEAWGEPRNLGYPVNSDANEIYPSVSNNGTLYFASDRQGGKGGRDVYCSRLEHDKYKKPENLGGSISTKFDEGDVFIAPDESYIIFVSSGRPDGYGSGDLYISFRKKDNTWAKAENMGDKINTNGYDYCPIVSPDRKFFFVTRERKGKGDIYWVDSKVIEHLRSE